MVMAPRGNLGGDNPYYPLQADKVYRVNDSGTSSLNSSTMTGLVTTPTLPAGQYLCIGVCNVSDVTAADEVIVKIQNGSAPFAPEITSAAHVAVGLSNSVTVIGVITLVQPDLITMSAQSGATANLTVNALDPATSSFQATYLIVIPWG